MCEDITFFVAPFAVRSTGISRILLDELLVISDSSDFALEETSIWHTKLKIVGLLLFLFGQIDDGHIGSFAREKYRYSPADSLLQSK
jgi:hypothetical protein